MSRVPLRILAIDPIPKGFAFVILEGEHLLVDWGYRTKGNDPKRLLTCVQGLIFRYQPDVIVVEDTKGSSHRRPAAKRIIESIARTAVRGGIRCQRISRDAVRRTLPSQGKVKTRIAEYIVELFPELADSFPRQRQWYDTGEDERMSIFDAAAIAVAFEMKHQVSHASDH